MPLAMTGYEIGLLSTALAFIAFALVVALVVPRSRPAFPTPYLGAFIGVCIVFFFVQMTGVVLLAEVGEAHDDVAHEESQPGETTEPAPTETKPTETTATETEPTATAPDEPTGTTPTETEPEQTDTDTPTETRPTETEPTETTEPETTETETTEASPPQPGANAIAGRRIFAAQGCGSCHTLADANASGVLCPNLDDTKPSFDLVVQRVRNGQGAMPAFGGRLTEQQIRDVAAYVSTAPNRRTT